MKLPIANCRPGLRQRLRRGELPIAEQAQLYAVPGGSGRAATTSACAAGTGRMANSRVNEDSGGPTLRWPPEFSQRENFHRSAFTLIEIMVVVGILGLVAAMGLPSIFKALQKEGMRKAVSDIQDVCFSAREQAIVFNKITAVVIVPGERRFGVEGASGVNSHSGKTLAATLPDGVELGALAIYRRDFTQSDWAKIFFNPDGTCDEAVIVLTAKGGTESHKITLEYATGIPVVSSVDR